MAALVVVVVVVLASSPPLGAGTPERPADPWTDARPVEPTEARPVQPATPIEAPARGQQQDTFILEIRDRAVGQKVTLALPPLSATPGAEEAARTLHEVLWQDLDWSMVFDLVPQDLYPQMEAGDARPDFAAWRRTGADALLHALVRQADDAIYVEFRLYDIRSGDQVHSQGFTDFIENARKIAHQINDDAVLYYTGIPGAADTNIAFVSDRTGPKEIFVMDSDGWAPRRITNDGFLGLYPALSPDGDRILYQAYLVHENGVPSADIALLQRRGGRPEPVVANAAQDTSPAWSPDGQWIAYSSSKHGNAEIYVARPDGSDERRVTFNSEIDTSPTFSPNGRQLAFISTRAGGQRLYTVGVDGTNVRRLPVEGGQIDGPAWNPQLADLIAYTASTGGNNFEIFVYSLVSGESRPLTTGYGRTDGPDWSPDGRQLVFESSQAGSTQVFAMGIDGSRLRALTRDGNNQSPSWGGRP